MNALLFTLFTLYVCWTLLIGIAMSYSLITTKSVTWQPAYRNTWLACTATVLLYFWFN